MVKHDNHTNVAEAVSAIHTRISNQALSMTSTTNIFEEEAVYFVNKPFNGVVGVSGMWEWTDAAQEKQASDIAAELSKQFNSYVVMALMGDDGESGICAIFQNGERKFRIKRWYEIKSLSEDGIKEFVERDGVEWAKQHGYVPDPDKVMTGDSDKAPFEDANNLIIKLGLDTSDEEYDEGSMSLVLKPASTAQPKSRPGKRR